MDFKEIISFKALRKFDAMCLKNEKLHQNKELQQQILSWAAELLKEAREDWGNLHATTFEAIIAEDRKAQAQKRGKARDNKYAPFREYFKKVQKEKFMEYKKAGQKLTANRFVEWFLENTAENIEIPYRQSNLKNKLIQLAQINNCEFKKSF
ncbi:MAG: hypothetical protein MJ212_06055 [Alphaproteobacteria bacterium]|nr:hypothetical protein [Alphaproteobacteria bacterium]